MANNEIVEQKQTFSDVMLAELESKKDGLPNGFNAQRFVMNAVSLINEHPELQKFGANQLKIGLLKGAVLDLDFYRKECYLIGYGSQLQFQMDYKGMTKLCKKYSLRPIKDIGAEIVREGDEFERVVDGNNSSFTFKPKPFNSGAIIGAFSFCRYVDGTCITEEMTKAELDKVRNVSKAKNSGAWGSFAEEMFKKVVIRRMCKKIELDFENNEQLNLFNDDTAINTEKKSVETDNPFDDTNGLEEI